MGAGPTRDLPLLCCEAESGPRHANLWLRAPPQSQRLPRRGESCRLRWKSNWKRPERKSWADPKFACLQCKYSCSSCATWGPCARVCGVMALPGRRGSVTPSPGSAPGPPAPTAPSKFPSFWGTRPTFASESLSPAFTSVTWRTALNGKAWGCCPGPAWGFQWWATKVCVCVCWCASKKKKKLH